MWPKEHVYTKNRRKSKVRQNDYKNDLNIHNLAVIKTQTALFISNLIKIEFFFLN